MGPAMSHEAISRRVHLTALRPRLQITSPSGVAFLAREPDSLAVEGTHWADLFCLSMVATRTERSMPTALQMARENKCPLDFLLSLRQNGQYTSGPPRPAMEHPAGTCARLFDQIDSPVGRRGNVTRGRGPV